MISFALALLSAEPAETYLQKTVRAKVECSTEWNASEHRFHGRILTLEKVGTQKLSVQIDEYVRAESESAWELLQAGPVSEYSITQTTSEVVSTDSNDEPAAYKLQYEATNASGKVELRYVRKLSSPFGEQGFWLGITPAGETDPDFRCGFFPVIRAYWYLDEI